MPPGHKLVLAFLGVFCTIMVALGIGLAVDMTSSPSGTNTSVSDSAEPDTAEELGMRTGLGSQRDGQSFPVKEIDLYFSYRSCPTCKFDTKYSDDYECRYSQPSRGCYCCGAFFHYQEQGKICTKFCHKDKPRNGRPKFCQKRLIVLPYNWGDNTPDRVTLDDGQLYRRLETEVDQPYRSSAKCPQDPFRTEITGSSGALPAPRNPQTTRKTTPARRHQPPQNAYPKISTNPKTTERPRQPKGPVSIGSGYCTDGGECVMSKECPSFNDLKSDWKSLARGSAEYLRVLGSLKEKICENKRQKVCCERKNQVVATPTRKITRRTTTSRTTLKAPTDSQSRSCSRGLSCVPMASCSSFADERDLWRQLPRGSRDYKTALVNLQARICHHNTQSVCCERKPGPEPGDPKPRIDPMQRRTRAQNSKINICPGGGFCQPMDTCQSFLREKSAWLRLQKRTHQYTAALKDLQSKICNKNTMTVCCY